MTEVPKVVISTKDTELTDEERESIAGRCRLLHAEFPETTHFEITIVHDAGSMTASGHVNGKNTEVASHAQADKPTQAADRVLDVLEKQLRRIHDKRIFSLRRDAQRNPPKKQG